MSKRIKKLLVTVAALAALAVGGAAFAGAQQSGPANPPVSQSAPNVEQVGGTDGDNVQAGDQSTPDNLSGQAEKSGSEAPEQAGSEQAGSEAETAPGNDGPQGHADEAGGGNANADHQFEGTE